MSAAMLFFRQNMHLVIAGFLFLLYNDFNDFLRETK